MSFDGTPQEEPTLDTDGFKTYCKALANSKLTSLDLRYLRCLGNPQLEALAEAVQQSRIKTLHLPSSVTNLDSFSGFGNALAESRVTDLTLGEGSRLANTLNREAFSAFLKSLANAKTLTVLDLSKQRGIGDDEIKVLASVLPDTALRALRLAGDISPEGYTVLAEALKQSQVTTLDLLLALKTNKECESLLSKLKSKPGKIDVTPGILTSYRSDRA